MRPPGEIREALLKAAAVLVVEQDAFTWRDLAVQAQVGYLAARRTVVNMARAGHLTAVGSAKRAHSRRWMTLYTLPDTLLGHEDWGTTPLGQLTQAWACARAVQASGDALEAPMT